MRIPGEGDRESLARETETSAVAEAVDRVAHQLKNPLQAMTVNLEVLRLRADRRDREETERVTGVVDENIRTVDRRIRMLIALARRSPEEPLTGLDLAETVREAGTAFRLDEREDGLGLRLRVPDDDGAFTVRAREGQLLALLLAVASGAAEGEGDDGAPYLTVGGDEEGAWIEVGPGVPWSAPGGERELRRQARRSGGIVVSPEEGESADPGPFRVRFPRA